MNIFIILTFINKRNGALNTSSWHTLSAVVISLKAVQQTVLLEQARIKYKTRLERFSHDLGIKSCIESINVSRSDSGIASQIVRTLVKHDYFVL